METDFIKAGVCSCYFFVLHSPNLQAGNERKRLMLEGGIETTWSQQRDIKIPVSGSGHPRGVNHGLGVCAGKIHIHWHRCHSLVFLCCSCRASLWQEAGLDGCLVWTVTTVVVFLGVLKISSLNSLEDERCWNSPWAHSPPARALVIISLNLLWLSRWQYILLCSV